MNAPRFFRPSYQLDQTLAKLVSRGGIDPKSAQSYPEAKAEQVKQALSRHFVDEEDEDLRLKDEFSAKQIELIVTKCQGFLQSLRGTDECWRQIGEFVEQELWEFTRLKEELAESESKVKMVRKKLEELSAPLDGVVKQTKVMACAMLLTEKEMLRDQLQKRVTMIIDQFVARILAGTQHVPGGEILELRLRAALGSR